MSMISRSRRLSPAGEVTAASPAGCLATCYKNSIALGGCQEEIVREIGDTACREVAHDSCVPRRHSWRRPALTDAPPGCRDESRHGAHECVRHVGASSKTLLWGLP